MSNNQHQRWYQPEGKHQELMVFNSLTDTKVPFIPLNKNQVKWYTCGPTVYDVSHLGHARSYVTFDIIRRIMTDYFGYDVAFLMNITDIDDKIILRSRQNYRLAEYEKQKPSLANVIKEAKAAFEYSLSKARSKINELEEKKKTAKKQHIPQLTEALDGEKLKFSGLEKTQHDVLNKSRSDNEQEIKVLIHELRLILAPHLDRTAKDTISDSKMHEIFRAHAARYEAEFFDDMRTLGVKDPDALTRVTEYVEQIISFIKEIISNNYAYASEGSVYFDTVKFKEDRFYAKLSPHCVGNIDLAMDGEGALGSTGEKRSQTDFALWKASKPGEPSWDSPWGKGRPGWHIECSAMATDVLGKNFDIHSGGEDLKFPHHDNEIAQSEAQSGEKQWCNYFWHAGHLNIHGLKMSKSLKNFLSIKGVLERSSPRQIRILFLLQPWNSKINYSENSLQEAAAKEKCFKEFFLNIAVDLRNKKKDSELDQLFTPEDRKLYDKIIQTQINVDSALCDSFDFSTALNELVDLVSVTNKYRMQNEACKHLLLKKAASYVDKILRCFGVVEDQAFGFSDSGGTDKNAAKYLNAWTKFRDEIRQIATRTKSIDILALCDKIRDDIMPELGVRIEDLSGKPSIWKLDDPKQLIKERDDKRRMAKENKLKKIRNQLKKRNDELTRWTNARLSASELMASMEDKYMQFNEKGMPTHDSNGKALSKKVMKKVNKMYNKQDKLHQKYCKEVKKDPSFMDKLSLVIKKLEEDEAAATAI